jgi:hypothetical protein
MCAAGPYRERGQARPHRQHRQPREPLSRYVEGFYCSLCSGRLTLSLPTSLVSLIPPPDRRAPLGVAVRKGCGILQRPGRRARGGRLHGVARVPKHCFKVRVAAVNICPPPERPACAPAAAMAHSPLPPCWHLRITPRRASCRLTGGWSLAASPRWRLGRLRWYPPKLCGQSPPSRSSSTWCPSCASRYACSCVCRRAEVASCRCLCGCDMPACSPALRLSALAIVPFRRC